MDKESAAKEKLEIVLSAPVQGEAGGRGVWGIPPAEPSQFRSDIFKQTPPNNYNNTKTMEKEENDIKQQEKFLLVALQFLYKRMKTS